jgi:hypothetical protein
VAYCINFETHFHKFLRDAPDIRPDKPVARLTPDLACQIKPDIWLKLRGRSVLIHGISKNNFFQEYFSFKTKKGNFQTLLKIRHYIQYPAFRWA